jgi:hypothetical protein
MPYLPARLSKTLVVAAAAAFGVVLFAGSADSGGYGQRYYPSYGPQYGSSYGYSADYGRYGYRRHGNGHDEIRELQRLFPETNWPPSMRYHQY